MDETNDTQYFGMDDSMEESSIPFSEVVQNLCTPPKGGRTDEISKRTAAVASALVEVVQDQLSNTVATSSMDKSSTVTPAALFAATLNAITATVTSSKSNDLIDNDDVSSSPQLPLLEILLQIIPYVSISNPNLYIQQFPATSRILRGIISSIPSTPSTLQQSQTSIGWNGLLRRCMKVSSTALNGILVQEQKSTSGSNLEKEVLKCFQQTIVQHFDDARPKVRRQAHASASELLHVSSQCILMEEQDGKQKKRKSPHDLKSTIPEYMVQYSHHILMSLLPKQDGKKSKKETEGQKKDKMIKILHLLSFLESSISSFDAKGRLTLGEDLVKLISHIVNTETTSSDNNQIMILNGSMAVLLQLLEKQDTEIPNTTSSSENEKEDAFCANVWAVLLQTNPTFLTATSPNDSTASSTASGEARILYARCVVTVATRLGSNNDGVPPKQAIQALVWKLLPMSFTSIVNCMGEDSLPSVSIQGICAELGRFIRSSTFSNLVSGGSQEEEKCVSACVEAIQKIVHYQYLSAWSSGLPCIASLVTTIVQNMIPSSGANEETISKMQRHAHPLIQGLIQLYSDVDDKLSKSAIEQSIGMIVEGLGFELFLGMVNLSESGASSGKRGSVGAELGPVSNDRAWILAVLKSALSNQSGGGAGSSISPYPPRLAFFQSHILGLARKCDGASASGNVTAVESSIHKSRVIDLWSLFPSFCRRPSDVELTFPTLSQTLVKAMSDTRYSKLMTIICTGLINLANSCSDNDKDKEILSKASVKLLPALFKMVETLHGANSKDGKKKSESEMDMEEDDEEEEEEEETNRNLSQEAQRIVSVTDTIAAYAQLAPEKFLKGLFKKIMQRLLLASQSTEDETEKICTLLGLVQALVKSEALNEESISLLYRSVRPLIRSDEHEASVQKRAYKVMAEICEHYTSFVIAPERLSEMMELMIGSVGALQISARYMRLRCIKFVVEGMDAGNETHMGTIPDIMGEVLLSLKDANGKTREFAYQLLITVAKKTDDVTRIFHIIVAALAAQTPHMRSAAVMAISRLTFDLAREDLTVQSLLPSLFQTVAALFDEQSREVVKSVIGFVRVSVAAMNKDQLEPLLPELVGGIMKYNRGKGRFRSKIKIILKKLVRTYGYEAITPLVPKNDTRLLTHMRKLSERAARRKAAMREDGSNRHDGAFEDLMDSDEDDSDGGRTLMTGATGFTQMTGATRKSMRSAMSKTTAGGKSVRSGMSKSMMSTKSMKTTGGGPRIDTEGELRGEILDMLDSAANKNVRFMDENDNDFSDDDSDGGIMEFDNEGMLLVNDAGSVKSKKSVAAVETDDGADDRENNEIYTGKKMRLSKFESAKVKREETHARKNQKKQKRDVKDLGSAYKSKKAGGDVQKKNQQYEPYAYVPLDGKSYSKKNRSKSVAQMSTVVRNSNKRKRR